MRNIFENNESDQKAIMYDGLLIGVGHVNASGHIVVDELYEKVLLGKLVGRAEDPSFGATDSAIRNNQNN